MDYKLGKKPAIFDRRTLKLSAYLDIPKLPPLPTESNWFKKVSKFNMGGNNQYGTCVVAGAAHMIQTWTANAGRHEVITPDQTIINQYFALTGGQDTGLDLLSFLNVWRRKGIFGGEKIGAFVSVNPRKSTQMQYANWLFGGIYLGIELPLAWQGAEVWDVGPMGPIGKYESGSWGGHCVAAGQASPTGYVVSTWGTKKLITAAGMMYADEAYAIIDLSWFDVNHKTPTGLSWKDLMSDLAKITG